MSLKYESAVLFVSDIVASKKFYCELLGMKTVIDMGGNIILENGLTLWQIQKDHIITQALGGKITKGKNNFEVYFETDDLTGVFNSIKDNKIVFLHEIHEEPWGQNTIRFYDPDENIVEVGESLKTFLTRLNNDGLAIKEIAKKSGMSENDVIKIIER